MRCLKGAVTISLVCNALLGISYVLGFARSHQGSAGPAEIVPPADAPLRVVEKIRTNTVRVSAPIELLDWRTVESEDYRNYIGNLRKIGCPEKTVRDVIVADVNELYRERFRESFPTTNRVQYWKSGSPLADLYDESRIARQRELLEEKRQLIKTLLGADYSEEDDSSSIELDSYSDRLLEFLSPEKRTAMKELEDKYAVKKMKTFKDSWRGNDGPADALQAEKDEEMLKVLTPEEKFEYDLRRSDTAVILRVGLKDFELSEGEFRSVFPAIKDFISQAGKPGFGTMMTGGEDPRPEGAAAREALHAKLAAALGNDRLNQLIDQTGWNLSADEPQ